MAKHSKDAKDVKDAKDDEHPGEPIKKAEYCPTGDIKKHKE